MDSHWIGGDPGEGTHYGNTRGPAKDVYGYAALGEKKGIERYGSMILPMDEALILCAIDFSGRDYLGYSVEIPAVKVGDFDCELCEEFWLAFVRQAQCTLHFKKLSGKNSHHIIEGMFKASARAIRAAVKIDPDRADEIPSTKGVL
jgi:imidazoleglycerol-phosphate dehydratase